MSNTYCDHRLVLCNDDSTAIRNFGFRHGILIATKPLINNEPFEIKIEVLMDSGVGCLDFGVTTSPPASIVVPETATSLRDSAWILSGKSILHDGVTINTNYGPDLGAVIEGDNLAVVRTTAGELMFYINGHCLGVAAQNVPEILYAVVDLCGKTAQVSINSPAIMAPTESAMTMEDLAETTYSLRCYPEYSATPSPELHPEGATTVDRSTEAPATSTATQPLLNFLFGNEPSEPYTPPDHSPDDAPPMLPTDSSATPSQPLAQTDESTTIKDSTLTEEMGADGSSTLTGILVDNLSMGAFDESLANQDRLRFHSRCGILVNLTNNNKTAERSRPLDDYNNGVVVTHRPLFDGEMFEIRIDRLIDKWSGSIEVGVTSHNPATMRFPNTMTNMDSGTIMMSGCKVLINGHATGNEYGYSNLDELREGDTVGMLRTASGKLHYFVNGVDQGVAYDKVEPQVWGVIDLYGMTVKVTIVDNVSEVNTLQCGALVENHLSRNIMSRLRPRIDEDSLLFHTLRDSDVVILNDGKTAHRPNANKYFHNGIVMTNRTLKTNELFQVRLDVVIPKWAGSIEIGVTQHLCNEIIFPFKMSNARSGTWAMTGEDVVRDGSVIIPLYVRDLNKLVEGDTVGVMRKEMGILHFFVNGIDQGMAAFNVPEQVFGIIDLYGRVGQVTIVDNSASLTAISPESPISSASRGLAYPELCFHRVHGHNVQLKHTRLTAKRLNVYSEFSDAVLFSSRPLRECEMFEIRIDQMVDCWIGSLEIGVTAILPEELEGAGAAGDLSWNTYVLSGSSIMKDGECVLSGYGLDLDKLSVGSRVGLMMHADRSLHFYQDGLDAGRALDVPHLNIYAVVDIYGQCTQVSIIQNEERGFNYCHSDNSALTNPRNSIPAPYCFSEYCGENVWLSSNYKVAVRRSADPSSALVFSSAYLRLGELFQIKILRCRSPCQGSLRLGLTDSDILNAHVNRSLPPSVSLLPHFTTYVDGDYMKCSSSSAKEHEIVKTVRPSFEFLRPGDVVAVRKVSTSKVEIYINSHQLDVAFEDVPDKVFLVAEIFGSCTAIKATSKAANIQPVNPDEEDHDPDCSREHREFCPVMKSSESMASVNDAAAANTPVAATPAAAAIPAAANTPAADETSVAAATPVAPAAPIASSPEACTPAAANTPVAANTPFADVTPVAPADAFASSPEACTPAAPTTPTPTTPAAAVTPAAANSPVAANTPVADETSVAAATPVAAAAPIASSPEDCTLAAPTTPDASTRAAPAILDASISAAPATPEAFTPAVPVIPVAAVTPIAALPAATATNPTVAVATPCVAPPPPTAVATTADRSISVDANSGSPNTKPRPFTFHDVCGENIELCSSETVAIRDFGFDKALTFIAHPLEQGKSCNFRVDKLEEAWSGSVMLGAVAALPDDEDELPDNALHLDGECWVIDHELKNVEGTLYECQAASALGGVDERAVLSLHLSSERNLEVHIDGDYVCTIATIPPKFLQLYPLIDLYGPVMQVSTLLHTYSMVHSTSVVLPLETDAQDYDFFPSRRVRPAYSAYENNDSEDEFSQQLDTVENSNLVTSDPETSIQECLGQETYDGDDVESDGLDWLIEEPVPGPVDPIIQTLDLPTMPEVDQPIGLFLEEVNNLQNGPPGVQIFEQAAAVEMVPPGEEFMQHIIMPIGQLDIMDVEQLLEDPVEDETEESSEDEEDLLELQELGSAQEPLHDPEPPVEQPLQLNSSINIEEMVPCPGPSTARDDEQLLQVLTQSALGAKRRRTSESPNDIYNRQLQRTKSNTSFPNDTPDVEPRAHSSRDSAESSSSSSEQPRPDNGPGPSSVPQRRPTDWLNQQPIVLREIHDGTYIDVTAEVHRDANIRQNALFPELNANGNDDSLDSEELMHALSESNNWPDLNEERSSSGENEATNASESFGRQEVEVHRYVNSNFGYLKNLIYYDEEPQYRVEYDVVEFDGTVATCEYLHAVLKYWKDLIPHYPENRQSIMWGNVECHCTHCNSTPEPCYSETKMFSEIFSRIPNFFYANKCTSTGLRWVRIRRNLSPPLAQAERVFWNVDGSLLRWVLLSDATTVVRASTSRPSALQIMPSSAPYFSTLWFDEERKPLRACSAIEIEKNYDEMTSTDAAPTLDRMVSLLLRLEAPVPNTEEDQTSPTVDDDDEFE